VVQVVRLQAVHRCVPENVVDRIQRAPVLRVCVRRLGLDRDFRRLRQRVSVQQDGQRGRVPGTFRVG